MNEAQEPNTIRQSSMPSEPLSSESSLDLTRALWQLRMLCCGLGLALMVVSLAFSAYVWKWNRNTAAETSARILQQQQAEQIQNNQKRLLLLTEELARYSLGNPELVDIFKRSGLNITANRSSNEPPASGSAPAPEPAATP